ncbi:hypothetical protein OH458_18915 [Vibrio sp. MarTm2]|uniref:hypothetical protein n=1 Tax=Vibrio sp. MarTm2 TaxID=2998831 RepID=UPI0022CD7317|nr:hypothetical protein [Vibrio sp. MarTm2]MDA0130149.1 hypothetical protein [Vibrio sp. MarTm2]
MQIIIDSLKLRDKKSDRVNYRFLNAFTAKLCGTDFSTPIFRLFLVLSLPKMLFATILVSFGFPFTSCYLG